MVESSVLIECSVLQISTHLPQRWRVGIQEREVVSVCLVLEGRWLWMYFAACPPLPGSVMELLDRAGLPPELVSGQQRLSLLLGLLLALVADVCGQDDS